MTCQSCKQPFVILPEDAAFYNKIGVQTPRHCPRCRAQQRLLHRNERALYRRKCDKCQCDIISMYSANKPYPVWCSECWWKDDWDPCSYGQAYDFARPFFDQWSEVWNRVPKVNLLHTNPVNSAYTNYCADVKIVIWCFSQATPRIATMATGFKNVATCLIVNFPTSLRLATSVMIVGTRANFSGARDVIIVLKARFCLIAVIAQVVLAA